MTYADETHDLFHKGGIWKIGDFEQFIETLIGRYHHIYSSMENNGYAMPWNSPLWQFTRYVKGWFKEDVTAAYAWKEVSRYAPKIAKRLMREMGFGRPNMPPMGESGWEYFDTTHAVYDYEAAKLEFYQNWGKIRYRIDEGADDIALRRAEAFPWTSPDTEDMPKYNRFLSFVIWLQFTVGDRPVTLAVRNVAKLLKTDIKMISRWRNKAVDDGHLVVVKEHVFIPGKKGRATEFRVKDGLMEFARERYAKLVGSKK